MPKLGMEPIRRRQLIEATIAAIHEGGLAEATVSRIGHRAGLSPGIIHHYFEDKDELLEATMRALASDFRLGILKRVAREQEPRARLGALIEGYLAPEQLTPQAVAAWLAFSALVRTKPRFARIQRVIVRRLHSNLKHELSRVVSAAEAERIAEGLGTLLDGLWLRAATAPAGPDPAAARRLALDYLELQLERGRTKRQA
jgi:TetR/AcrR family transcriptional regulator, transcriptional repressor of bet genes